MQHSPCASCLHGSHKPEPEHPCHPRAERMLLNSQKELHGDQRSCNRLNAIRALQGPQRHGPVPRSVVQELLCHPFFSA